MVKNLNISLFARWQITAGESPEEMTSWH